MYVIKSISKRAPGVSSVLYGLITGIAIDQIKY